MPTWFDTSSQSGTINNGAGLVSSSAIHLRLHQKVFAMGWFQSTDGNKSASQN